jgi:hypothetical protein
MGDLTQAVKWIREACERQLGSPNGQLGSPNEGTHPEILARQEGRDAMASEILELLTGLETP